MNEKVRVHFTVLYIDNKKKVTIFEEKQQQNHWCDSPLTPCMAEH